MGMKANELAEALNGVLVLQQWQHQIVQSTLKKLRESPAPNHGRTRKARRQAKPNHRSS